MALPLPVMASPIRCRSIVEGVPMLILHFKLMDFVPRPQPANLGGPASGKLLL